MCAVMKQTESIVIMTCFARSGGTLLNQCLATLPGTLMFSEVSPLRPKQGVPQLKQQALEWYNLSLSGTSFTECVSELAEEAAQRGKTLVLRDWPLRCFEGRNESDTDTPDRLVIGDYLPDDLTPCFFAFMRDAYDVYLSRRWGKGFPHRYLNYVQAIGESGMPFFRYEDFCHDPEKTLKAICAETGLTFTSAALTNFSEQTQVTGDVSLGNESRGQRAGQRITEFPRRLPLPDRVVEMITSSALREANRQFGYSPTYFSRAIAWPWAHEEDSTRG